MGGLPLEHTGFLFLNSYAWVARKKTKSDKCFPFTPWPALLTVTDASLVSIPNNGEV